MKNMGTIDRIIRVILGLALVGAGVYFRMNGGSLWWLAIPGVVFLLTSVFAFCPLYLPFKISTKSK